MRQPDRRAEDPLQQLHGSIRRVFPELTTDDRESVAADRPGFQQVEERIADLAGMVVPQALVRLKNTAYAWRQMVFYLSFVDGTDSFMGWARARLARKGAAFEARFGPALRGLELAALGIDSSTAAFTSGGGRVFTGWTTERHWLLG